MIIYQVLPRIFGSGKFSTFDAETLGYIRGLGVDCVWYTGIPRHATGEPWVKGDLGSPYSITDYYDTNPYLADNQLKRMDEFEQLVKRTHEAGMKVLMDFVPNHVARDYADAHGGIPTFPWCDYDWTDTLKINYSAAGTWQKMLDIILFWAAKGVDGFRCDMVELVSAGFFKWLIGEAKRQFTHLIFVAEVYGRDNYSLYIHHAGFDYLYDKSGMYDALRAIYAGNGTARSLTWNWQFLGTLQPQMLHFLENHDEQRLASPAFAGSAERGLAGLAVSALFTGAPFMLYAGQELGEAADSPVESDYRTSIFNRGVPASLARLDRYIHLPEKAQCAQPAGVQDVLQPAELEILERYRTVLTLKERLGDSPNYDLCYCSEGLPGFNADKHFAFARADADALLLVVCNFSDEAAEVTVRIPAAAVNYLGLNDKCHPREDGISVSVDAWGAALVRL